MVSIHVSVCWASNDVNKLFTHASLVYTYTYFHIQNLLTCKNIITGIPAVITDVTVDISVNGNNVTLTLSWGEPFNNFDPIVNYTVSCSGDNTCPQIFTTDNTIRSYTITNLTTMTNYTFSVVATNSIGSGEAGVLNYTTPGTYVKMVF